MTDKAKFFLLFISLWLIGITACAVMLSVAGCKAREPRTATMKKTGWFTHFGYSDGTRKVIFNPIALSASSGSFRIDWIEVHDKKERR